MHLPSLVAALATAGALATLAPTASTPQYQVIVRFWYDDALCAGGVKAFTPTTMLDGLCVPGEGELLGNNKTWLANCTAGTIQVFDRPNCLGPVNQTLPIGACAAEAMSMFSCVTQSVLVQEVYESTACLGSDFVTYFNPVGTCFRDSTTSWMYSIPSLNTAQVTSWNASTTCTAGASTEQLTVPIGQCFSMDDDPFSRFLLVPPTVAPTAMPTLAPTAIPAGLSSNEVAGIVIGCIVGVAAIISLAAYFGGWL